MLTVLGAGGAAAQEGRTIELLKDWWIDGGAAATFIRVPKTQFTLIEASNFNTLDKHTNHDGNFWAPGFDLGIERRNLPFGPMGLNVRASGYYARGASTQDVVDVASFAANHRVGWNAPFDPVGKIGFFAGTTTISTRARATIWGGNLTVGPSQPWLGGLFPRVGFSYKSIRTHTEMFGSNPANTVFTMNYEERLRTNYYGAVLGVSTEPVPMGAGIWVGLDLEGGPYWARTHYDSAFTAPGLDGGGGSLGASRFAFVGAARVTIWRDFGFLRVGVFGRGEFYSYAPKMAYQDVEPFSGGLVSSTSIGRGHAYTAAAGLRVSVPLP